MIEWEREISPWWKSGKMRPDYWSVMILRWIESGFDREKGLHNVINMPWRRACSNFWINTEGEKHVADSTEKCACFMELDYETIWILKPTDVNSFFVQLRIAQFIDPVCNFIFSQQHATLQFACSTKTDASCKHTDTNKCLCSPSVTSSHLSVRVNSHSILHSLKKTLQQHRKSSVLISMPLWPTFTVGWSCLDPTHNSWRRREKLS